MMKIVEYVVESTFAAIPSRRIIKSVLKIHFFMQDPDDLQ